jgi:hypothetical protein
MRIARKLALLLAMAFAAMALAASGASAQEAVEVEHEGGAHCDISANPCEVTAHGESHLSVFGFIVSNCEDEFTASIGEDGTGHITSATLVDHSDGGDCTRIPCNGVGESPAEVEWDIDNTRETAVDTGVMDVNFCLDAAGNPNGVGTHCNAPITVRETTGTHNYTFSTGFNCPSGVRVEGTWTAEGTPIEIEHDVP